MLAVIGCGEVGLLYAKAFRQKGLAVVLCDPAPRQETKAFAADQQVPLQHSAGPWLAEADAVLSCVVGSLSLAVARQAFPHLRRGSCFVDMTTSDPDDVRLAGREAAEGGIAYADVAIMGAIALSGVQTNLLVAGPAADATLQLFSVIGAPTRTVGAAPGEAAALKILRSVFTKGLEALAVETFLAAEHQNMTDKLHEALSDIDAAPLRATLEVLIRTHVVHAERRLKEVKEAERQLLQAALPVDVLPGVQARFERTCALMAQRQRLSTSAIPSLAEALALLSGPVGAPEAG